MVQHAAKYITQMTDILLKFYDLGIINKQITKEKDKFVQNLQGILEKGQKLKAKLQVKQDDNNEVLAKLQTTRQKINNMEKHNKDLKKSRVEKDFLQSTLMHTNVNYYKLKTQKDSLGVERNKLQRDYKDMEQTFIKQPKELKELREDIGNVYQPKMKYKGNLTKDRQRWIKMCRGIWLLMKYYNKF